MLKQAPLPAGGTTVSLQAEARRRWCPRLRVAALSRSTPRHPSAAPRQEPQRRHSRRQSPLVAVPPVGAATLTRPPHGSLPRVAGLSRSARQNETDGVARQLASAGYAWIATRPVARRSGARR